jgi:glycogen operon protein
MLFLNGQAIPEPDGRGERIVGDSVLALLNAAAEPIEFQLPGSDYGARWAVALDTTGTEAVGDEHEPGARLTVEGRGVVVLLTSEEAGE